jgi:hypothetical protein
MKKVAALLGVTLALLPAGLLAQAASPPVPSSASALNSPVAPSASTSDSSAMGLTAGSAMSATNPPPAPLTLPQKYTYALKDAFQPARLLYLFARAGVDQANDSPKPWGGGTNAYAVRVASRVGSNLVKENIAFGVAAVDHEERRYFRLGESSSGWLRTRHAVRRAFIARSENGGEMLAYSNFVSAFSAPFITQAWRPDGVKGGRELRGGSISMGMNAATNLWKEFIPDFTKRHQMKKSVNP